MVSYSIIGALVGASALLFYDEQSPLMILGGIFALAFGVLFAIVTGAFQKHPSAASAMVKLDALTHQSSPFKIER